MKSSHKRWFSLAVRWGIAIAGITYVLWNIPLRDRVRVLSPSSDLQSVQVHGDAIDAQETFVVGDDQRQVPREALWTMPDRKAVQLPYGPGRETEKWTLLGLRPIPGDANRAAAELLVQHPKTREIRRVPPAAALESTPIRVNFPLVERGVSRMVREADWIYLAAAILLLPLSYLLTSYRWHVLLEAQGIHIGMARTFVINMVGAFYNSIMLGSTGGDLVKAYYASKHTTHRTRAVLTVIIDRVIGLLALLLLGGTMAAIQWHIAECRQVALVAGGVLAMTFVGAVVFYQPTLHRMTGLDWLLKKLPMQQQVTKAVDAMHTYGRRPGVVLWAFACSFPVHVISILSATMAGQAFHLPLDFAYYWVVVPVIALVGAIPISPQGAGVMEFFAVQLTKHRGVSNAQALALVMSIRLIQILWNLVAGVFVLRGGFHAPTAAEQNELEVDAPETPAGQPAPADAPVGDPSVPLRDVSAG
jgi:uncharacterized protein (TIRG00374 family)